MGWLEWNQPFVIPVPGTQAWPPVATDHHTVTTPLVVYRHLLDVKIVMAMFLRPKHPKGEVYENSPKPSIKFALV